MKKLVIIISLVLVVTGCKTKREIRREQEYEKIKADVREARGTRADLEVISEEFRTELTRVSTAVEEVTQLQRTESEDMKRELQALSAKVQALEQQVAAANAAPPPRVHKSSFEDAKRFYDEEKFEEAIDEAKAVIRSKAKGSGEARKAQFLLGEAYFASRDYGAAALAFSEFKKEYPRDGNVANATLRQAQCFKNLGKEREAKLFYQEVVDKYPKTTAATQARKELKKK